MTRHSGRIIDYKAWDAIPSLATDVSTDTTIQGGAIAFTQSATILRCRGFVQASFDETAQVGDLLVLIWGLGIISKDAFAAAATPDPASDPEYPWLWWGSMELHCIAV